MPDIIPNHVPSPRTALYWDGTAYRPATIDATGHLQIDVLTPDALRGALHSVNTDELVVRGEDQLISFKSNVLDKVSGAVSGANGFIDSGAVPVGEIWKITNISARDSTTATTIHMYRLGRGLDLWDIYELRTAFAISQRSMARVELWMIAGDFIRVFFTGALAGDTVYLDMIGHSMTKEV